jgi:hypothetical protein
MARTFAALSFVVPRAGDRAVLPRASHIRRRDFYRRAVVVDGRDRPRVTASVSLGTREL